VLALKPLLNGEIEILLKTKPQDQRQRGETGHLPFSFHSPIMIITLKNHKDSNPHRNYNVPSASIFAVIIGFFLILFGIKEDRDGTRN
jgi:hypothetical protein